MHHSLILRFWIFAPHSASLLVLVESTRTPQFQRADPSRIKGDSNRVDQVVQAKSSSEAEGWQRFSRRLPVRVVVACGIHKSPRRQ